jgi:hypothetical protein
VERPGVEQRLLGRHQRGAGVAEVHQRRRSEPRDHALPDVVERTRRHPVERGEDPAAVVHQVDDQGAAEAGERDRLRATFTLELEHPADEPHQPVGVFGPPRQLAELHEAGQLAGQVTRLAEAPRDVVEAVSCTTGVGLDRDHGGEQPAGGLVPDLRREPCEPVGEHVRGDRRMGGTERLDGRRGHRVPRSGIDQQAHRGGDTTPVPEQRRRLPACLRDLVRSRLVGEERAPQRVEGPLPARHLGHERKPPGETPDVDIATERGPGQLVVERAEVGE